MADTNDVQQRTLEVLEEILKWTRITSIPQVKKTLEEMLASAGQVRAYHHSTGNNSRTVAEVAGVGRAAILVWWKSWQAAGLGEMRSVQRGNRFVRTLDLEDFGIAVPSKGDKGAKKQEKAEV